MRAPRRRVDGGVVTAVVLLAAMGGHGKMAAGRHVPALSAAVRRVRAGDGRRPVLTRRVHAGSAELSGGLGVHLGCRVPASEFVSRTDASSLGCWMPNAGSGSAGGAVRPDLAVAAASHPQPARRGAPIRGQQCAWCHHWWTVAHGTPPWPPVVITGSAPRVVAAHAQLSLPPPWMVLADAAAAAATATCRSASSVPPPPPR